MAATEVYAAEEDHLAMFMEDRVHLGGGSLVRVNTTEFRAAYVRWCDLSGERGLSPQVLGRELRTRFGVEQVKSNGTRFYVGLTLLADEDEPDRGEQWWEK